MISTSSHSIFLISVPVLWDVNNVVHCLRIGLDITILSVFRVSSPYWGLFFILKTLKFVTILQLCISFRPHTGDYFFIYIKEIYYMCYCSL